MISSTVKKDLLVSIEVIMEHYGHLINAYNIITSPNSIELIIQPLNSMKGNDYVDLLVTCRELCPTYNIRILDDSAYLEDTASFSLTYYEQKQEK